MKNQATKRSGTDSKPRKTKIKQKYPPGWNEQRVRKVIAHYDKQTEDEALAEDIAACNKTCTMVAVPTELVPAVIRLITRHQKKNGKPAS